MCSTKPQQTVNIIGGENRISEEQLTVSDAELCFDSSQSTVRCSFMIIQDKKVRINTSIPQKDEILKNVSTRQRFPALIS